jgi:signal transduction histidine kinase
MWFRRFEDVLLAIAVLAAQLAPFLFVTPSDPSQSWSPLGYAAAGLASLPVALRRHVPLLWLFVSTLGIVVYEFGENTAPQPIWFGPLICMYTVAYLSPRIHRVIALAGTGLGMTMFIGSLNTAAREVATWSTAYAIGALMRTRREAAAAAERQAADLATERERTRIARDLHDILGHAFSLMIVQAETGAALARHDPARAEKAFDTISATGREAMTQLRGTVGNLRQAPRVPQPGLDDIPELVRRTGSTGVTVTLAELGDREKPPPDVQLAAYRVVQEALTNVVRHAGAARAEVTLDWRGDGLRVSIVDDGRASGTKEGNGLTGIRERVGAVGGTVEITTHGGFEITAMFPSAGRPDRPAAPDRRHGLSSPHAPAPESGR